MLIKNRVRVHFIFRNYITRNIYLPLSISDCSFEKYFYRKDKCDLEFKGY